MTEPIGQATHEHIINLLLEHRADTIKRLEVGEKRMTSIEAELLMNTEITREIRDAVTAGKMMSRLIRWVGGIAAAGAAIWAAAVTIMGGGKPPSPV